MGGLWGGGAGGRSRKHAACEQVNNIEDRGASLWVGCGCPKKFPHRVEMEKTRKR